MSKKKSRIIKGRDYRDNRHTDGLRKSKPVGYRYKGDNKFGRPTQSEIEDFHDGKRDDIYYENRLERSDKKASAKRGMRFDEGGNVWTAEQTKKVSELDSDFEKEVEEKGINPNSKEASDFWRSGGFKKRMADIFGKTHEYKKGGEIISDNWGNDGSTASNNKDYNDLYAMFPDSHKEARDIWNQLSEKQKKDFLYDLDVTDAASEHISDSWLEFVNAKSEKDWLDNSTNWDEMKTGGVVGEWRKGTTIKFKTKKEATNRFNLMKTSESVEYRNLKIKKYGDGDDKLNDGYVIVFEYLKKDNGYSTGGVVESLEKELRKLQRDLNSSRLGTYREGDVSDEAKALRKEREVKLARFNEVLQLLREKDNKHAKGGGMDDYTKNLGMVDVIFKNPKYNYSTNVSGSISEEEAKKYFVGKTFDVGIYPKENMQTVIDAKFHAKGTYAKGGSMKETNFTGYLGEEISISTIETALGRKLHWWDDDIVKLDGVKYKKCFMRPYYKQI